VWTKVNNQEFDSIDASNSPVEIPSMTGIVRCIFWFKLLLNTASIPGPGDAAEAMQMVINAS
jgi:hypothetical protein